MEDSEKGHPLTLNTKIFNSLCPFSFPPVFTTPGIVSNPSPDVSDLSSSEPTPPVSSRLFTSPKNRPMSSRYRSILGPFSNRYRSNYERSATCSVSKSHQSPLIYQLMKPTTRKRYERIRQAAAHMYGTMPVMHLYAALAHDFDLSEERIRKILAKNAPP